MLFCPEADQSLIHKTECCIACSSSKCCLILDIFFFFLVLLAVCESLNVGQGILIVDSQF